MRRDPLYVIEQPPYQAAMAQSQAAVALAEAQLSNAITTLNRQLQLLHTPAGQQSTVDNDRATQLSDAAQLASARAQLETASISLGYTEIRAPIAGRIGITNITEGNVVGPSSGTLATIVSQDPMYVAFEMPVVDALRLYDRYRAEGGRAALGVLIVLPDGQTYSHTGNVDFHEQPGLERHGHDPGTRRDRQSAATWSGKSGAAHQIELGARQLTTQDEFGGNPGVGMDIFLTPGANAVATSAALNKALAQLSQCFPAGLKVATVYDSASFVTDTIREVAITLGEAFLLVVLVMFPFLSNFRAVIVPTVVVPVSLIGTFAVPLALGQSANTINLLALVVAVDIVGDDAIVVVENIERVMEEEPELPAAVATKKAMQEITAPIIAISLVLFIYFRACCIHSGSFRTVVQPVRHDRQHRHADSATNALILSPALCAIFLRPADRRQSLMAPVLRGIDGARRGYAAAVARLVPVAGLALVAIALFAGGVYALSERVRGGFLPDKDQGALFHPNAASAGGVACAHPSCGRSALSQDQGAAAGTRRDRHRRLLSARQHLGIERRLPGREAAAVRRAAGPAERRRCGDSPGLRTWPASPRRNHHSLQSTPIIGLSTNGGFRYMLYNFQGASTSDLTSVANALIVAESQNPNLARVFTTFSASTPAVYLDIDRTKAQALGVSIADIFTSLQATLGGYFVNDFNLFDWVWQVNIQGLPQDRNDISAIWKIYVRSNTGAMVPLRALATAHIVLGPAYITRYNDTEAVPINGSLAPGVASSRALAAMEAISARPCPPASATTGPAPRSRRRPRAAIRA